LKSLRRGTILAPAVLSLGAWFAVGTPADAQVLYGGLVGNVADPSGAAVPGVSVILIHEQTNLARETTTRPDGGYRFVNVQEGTYTVRATLQGFKEYVERGIPVATSTVARVDVTLEVGSLSEAVTVQSERTLLQTDTGELRSELNSEEVRSLPLGSFRNYQTLLNLVPGTTPHRSSNAITDTPARSLNTNVNGTARNNNNTRLDGAVTVFVWLPHHAVYVAPAETVDTVSTSTSSFDAEQGMAGGAAVTVMTRSGSNQFHGSGTFLFENDALRARNFFNPGEKPESSRKIGAATLGGPIMKDRLFFFGAWEGHYLTGGDTRTGTVPTEAMRAGDFSAFDTTIYDPLTGNPDGTGRTPFPGNLIPADRISPISANIQSRIPLPTRDGVASNLTRTGNFTMDRNNYDFKLNWNLSPALQLWAKYSQMDADVSSDMWLGNPDEGGIGGTGFGVGSGVTRTRVKLGTLGWTWTISPTFLVDGNVSHARFDQEGLPPDFGTDYGTDVFRIPGTNGDGGSNGDPRTSGMPGFSISGFERLGNPDGWSPLFRNDRTWNVTVNATWIEGRHEMRFGADVVRLELTHWQPELGPGPRGQFTFNGGATALGPSGSPNQINAYAQFLLGLTTDAGKGIQHEVMTGREWQFGLYFRDRWQVSRNLTLNLGLRWERYPLMTRADRGIEYYDDTTNQVLLGGRGGNPEDLGIEVRHRSLLPRIGFAYRLGENNVFRGGYGMNVSPIPFSRPLRGFYPAVVAETFVGPNPFVPFGTLEEGIPLFYGPDLDTGVVDLPPTAGMASPYIDRVTRGTIQSWNLTYERRLPWDVSLATSYVGTLTTNQLGFRDINAAGAGEGRAGQPLFAAYGRTAFTWRYDGWLSASYHGLQVALNKPFSRGFFIKAAYSWAKAMNRTDDDGWSNVLWSHPSVLSKNYAVAGYDRTHIFQLGFVAELPFGRGGSGALNALLRDWVVNGVVSGMSGRPLTVLASGASVNAPGNQQTADLVGTPTVLGGIGPGNPYYDPSAWAPVTEARFGNTGRNSVRQLSRWNIDLGLFRRFPLGSKVTLEARVEAFNLTNTPHFDISTAGFARSSVNSGNFMTVTQTDPDAPERQVRLGLRLSW
jgi:hypothetical protein